MKPTMPVSVLADRPKKTTTNRMRAPPTEMYSFGMFVCAFFCQIIEDGEETQWAGQLQC